MDNSEKVRLFAGLLDGRVTLRDFNEAGTAEMEGDLSTDVRVPAKPLHVRRMIRRLQRSEIPERALLNWAITVASFDDVYGPNDSTSRTAWFVIEALVSKYDPGATKPCLTEREVADLLDRLSIRGT